MKIVWTEFANQSLKEIFYYYLENVNRKTALKIRLQILKSTRRLEKYPNLGQKETLLEKLGLSHRYILCGNYKVIYRINENKIIINDVFHTSQNPDQLKKLF